MRNARGQTTLSALSLPTLLGVCSCLCACSAHAQPQSARSLAARAGLSRNVRYVGVWPRPRAASPARAPQVDFCALALSRRPNTQKVWASGFIALLASRNVWVEVAAVG